MDGWLIRIGYTMFLNYHNPCNVSCDKTSAHWAYKHTTWGKLMDTNSGHNVRNRMLVSLRGGGGELGNLKP
jgi:hypothetical protein